MSDDQRIQEALTRHRAGDRAGAVELYRAVLAENPRHPDALHMLGLIAQQAGNTTLALNLIDATLAVKPDFAQAWYHRCVLLRAMQRPDEALYAAREAVGLDPNLAEAWDMAGSILREKRRYSEAISCLEQAMRLRPNSVQILNSYGVLLAATGRLRDAWQVTQQMEAMDDASAEVGKGNILKAAGWPERAIPYFQNARIMKPDFYGAVLNEAMARLQVGDFDEGWRLWERRFEDPERKDFPAPRWYGGQVGHLLLREDQGLGDALQCVRYIALIQKRVGRVTLQVTGILKSLLLPNVPDGVSLITLEDPTPQADAAAQLMSLPAICNTQIDTIPAARPYINAKEEWRAPWRERLAHIPHPRIGIVWGGNPDNRHDVTRALNFSQLSPILDAAPGHFVSLQKGKHRNVTELAAAGVYDAEPYLDNFTATAGLMAELDLVISVCSSPAHLAGALGRPTWVMLCFDPHWLWMLERDDTPWYPSARLFRQTAPDDWLSVTAAIARDLRRLVRGDASVLNPAPWNGQVARENPHRVDLGL
jgi:tetratricopeptide (TPR) repeat protein